MQEQTYTALEDGYGISKEGWDDGYMQPMNCPSCGLVPSATGTCGYCGSTCE